MKIIAFAASSSTKSINKKLVTYASSLLKNASVEVLDLNDYELPIFSEDKETELGQPELAKQFLAKIKACDAVMISFAEHNGSYSAAYKNIFDWCSRINPKVYQNKSVLLLATSPGKGGGANVLSAILKSMPFFGGVVKGSFSLPQFYENFDIEGKVVSSKELAAQLKQEVEKMYL
ncbi:MAG: NAD(P)H-dependent oxidoreductase [Gammaproteobacteria bacterium]|nr:NAD(P)H-dependent oxidoreductase [Gammaproteobacteria bacterium]